MTKEKHRIEVTRVGATKIRKLKALAAPDSGATEGERSAALASIERVKTSTEVTAGMPPPLPATPEEWAALKVKATVERKAKRAAAKQERSRPKPLIEHQGG
jgi:hypothetical protein